MKYKPSHRTIVCGIVRNPRNASRVHASAKASLSPRTPACFIIISSVVLSWFAVFPVYFLLRRIWRNKVHRCGRWPWPFSRLRSGKSSPCDTQRDSPAQYCDNKDIWRISSCAYGILSYCKQSFREDGRRNFANGVYTLRGFDELSLPILPIPLAPHANARRTCFRFFRNASSLSRAPLASSKELRISLFFPSPQPRSRSSHTNRITAAFPTTPVSSILRARRIRIGEITATRRTRRRR